MLRFALRRILVALAVAVTVSVASFLLLHLSGDLAAAIGGPDATAAQIEEIRKQYGLDQPMPAQFLAWAWKALHLDFGKSYYFRERVVDLVASRLPVTLILGVVALAVALFVAIPLGVAGGRETRHLDRPGRPVRLGAGASDAEFLVRPDPDHDLLGQPALAAGLGQHDAGGISCCRPSRSATTPCRRSCG